MRLSVRHITRYEYDPPAQRTGLRLKLFPSTFATQKPAQWRVSVNGAPVAPMFNDSYGDAESVWTSGEALNVIEVIAEGAVDVEDSAGVVRGLMEPARPGVFLRSTPLTKRDPAIEALGASVGAGGVLASLHQLCGAVADAVIYEPRATHALTSAAEALKLGRGVCQDHAHIFIAAARHRGVPARYVAGYFLTEGTEQTHAWAEAYVPELGWVGFDPTNRQCPTDSYVRLCAGLDAADAAPVRGSVMATHQEVLTVSVQIGVGQQQQ